MSISTINGITIDYEFATITNIFALIVAVSFLICLNIIVTDTTVTIDAYTVTVVVIFYFCYHPFVAVSIPVFLFLFMILWLLLLLLFILLWPLILPVTLHNFYCCCC